ncbi:hypothetical protein EX30DRAFT_72709 [Ascodesmis nigricans]|uniref:Uncharacterized protein n=1 Tax=Ascodesmis nigricans TaxID=341454 RepID=A0A4S2MTV1_9PEZI|nr:hypothetical protein EX30DRAFT_72709 [Ascodesmis nigricans]
MRDEGLPHHIARKNANEENLELLRDATVVREEAEEARRELEEERKSLQELKEARAKAMAGNSLEAMEEREILGLGGRKKESGGKKNKGKGKELQKSHTEDAPEVDPHGQPERESDSEASLYLQPYSSFSSKTPQLEKGKPVKAWKRKAKHLTPSEPDEHPLLESEDVSESNSNFEPSSSEPPSSQLTKFSETPPPTRRSARNKRPMQEPPEIQRVTTRSNAKKAKLETEQLEVEVVVTRSRKRRRKRRVVCWHG